jgi:tetratricopeptide (TPR) repeat protein
MPTPPTRLTSAELSSLEHAFAADPASEAFRPLTEAYLSMGRFMEAMVVCKKGVKAHPDDPSAKVLLARVYADQGKDRKALEELQAVLAAYPTFAAALRLAGGLHLRLGEREAGEAVLRRAAEVAPDDPEVQEALAKHGLAAAPRKAPPPAADAPPVAPRVAPAAPTASSAARAPAPAAPAPRPGAAAAAAAAASPAPPARRAGDESSVEVPLPTPVPDARARGAALAAELADRYATREFTLEHGVRKPRKRRGTLATTAALFAVLVVALGGWVLFNQARKERIEAIDRLLKEILPLVDKDVHAAYVEAAAKAGEILKRDDTSIAGHAYLAYVSALRAGEHGEEAAKDVAVQHVDAGRALGQRHSHLVAAEAYLKSFGGDPAGAKEALGAVLEGDGAGQSPFLLGVQGAVLLRDGDLDAARDALGRAQKASPGDVRIAWLLAEQFRRRGVGYELQASGFYDYALRIQKEHLPSMLGKALVLLERGQLDEAERAAEAVLAPAAAASPPQQALAHAVRAGVLSARGKAAEAAKAEAEAARLDPRGAEIPRLAGLRRLRAGDVPGAIEALQRAALIEPRRLDLTADLVRAQLAADGGAQKAVDTLKRAVTRLGEGPRLALLLGDAYRAAGDMDLAQGQYRKAIELGRPFPDARVALARLHRARNDIPGALVELTQAIDEYGQGGAGGAAAAFVEMADAERARGAKREVLADLYEKALSRDPASCEALWGAGKLEAEAGRLGETGRQRLEAYAKLCPRAANAAEAARLAGGK